MRKITRFLREAYAELRKVVWPTRRRTARLTVIVAVITVMTGGLLAGIDYGLGKGIKYVLDNTQQPGSAETQPAPANPSQVQTLPDPTQPQPAQQPPTQ